MKLNNLQILRFIAASLVLFSHVQHQAVKLFASDASFAPFEPIYWAGGVDIFFVISGFIMYYITSDKFGMRGAPADFLLKRLVRIAPPYWLFTLLMVLSTFLFAKHISHPDFSLSLLLSSLFFIPKINSYGLFYPVLMLGWTLNFEFFFYIVFSLGLLFGKRLGVFLIFTIMFFVASLKYFLPLVESPFAFYSNSIIFEFVLGILLAMFYLDGFRISVRMSFMLVILSVIAMVFFQSFGIASQNWEYRFLWMGIPAVLLCAGFVLNFDDGIPPSAFMKRLSFLGDASYSLYLSHPFSLNLIALAWTKLGISYPWIYIFISCVFSLLCAVLVFTCVERPLVDSFSRLLPRKGMQ